MRSKILLSFLALCFVGAVAQPASARSWREGPEPGFGPGPESMHHWHGDISHFHEHDFDYWHGGRWIHGPHDGRMGWWWIVGDGWYFYNAPVYPYPDPYTPPTVVVEGAPAGATVYWYCPSVGAYYPYVAECPTPWVRKSGGGETVVVQQPATTVVMQAPAVAAPAPAATPDQRTLDDRALNSLGSEFTQIPTSPKKAALRKLKDLEDRVEFFRKTLLSRSYNAMDLLRDTEKLRDQIISQEDALKAAKK